MLDALDSRSSTVLMKSFSGNGFTHKLARQFDRKDVPFDLHTHLQRMTIDPWFKRDQCVIKLFLDFFDIRRKAPVQLANAEVDDGAKSFFVISKCDFAYYLVRVVADRIEKPLQIAKHSRFITLDRNDPLVAALLSVSRLVVRETI